VDPHRAERVAEAIREELDELINYELDDPRVHGASVAEVVLTPDRKRAVIRVQAEGGAEEQHETLVALENARNFLRRSLGERLDLYRTPDLHFEALMPVGLDARAPRLLRRIRKGRPRERSAPESEKNTRP
jgi:ribosome-binding factor A